MSAGNDRERVYGSEFADEMADDPNMGMSPRWASANPNSEIGHFEVTYGNRKGAGAMERLSYDETRQQEVCDTGDYEFRMIDFEDALELARSEWDEVDYVVETDDAYLFRKKDLLTIGGGFGPVVIRKLGGELGNYVSYAIEEEHEILREGYIDDFSE